MKFLIAGAGAIGAYIGARMAQAGFEVTLFARGPHLLAMQEHGVQVKSPEGDFVARPTNRQFPRSIGTGRRCLSWGEGAWPAATCSAVEARIGTRDHSRQHAEWNPMVVLPWFRWRMGGIAPGACRSRRGDFLGHRSAVE